MTAILTGMRWYLAVVCINICISLVINSTGNLFMYLLGIWISSWEKYVFSGLLLIFLYWIVWAVCIFWILTPCQSYHLQILSPIHRVSLLAQLVKNLPAVQETWVQSLVWEDPLEKRMATNSNILAWRIPWMEEPGGLLSMHLWKSQTQLSD